MLLIKRCSVIVSSMSMEIKTLKYQKLEAENILSFYKTENRYLEDENKKLLGKEAVLSDKTESFLEPLKD